MIDERCSHITWESKYNFAAMCMRAILFRIKVSNEFTKYLKD